MQCQHAHELFSDYAADQLDRALVVTVDNHLSQCASCREELAGLRRIWTSLDEMPAVDPPPFFHENLMHRLDAALSEQEASADRRRALWDWRALFRPRTVAFAATLLIVLFAGAGLMHTQSAAMWPFSMFVSRPAPMQSGLPALRKPEVEWVPNGAAATGGMAVVHLQLDRSAVSTPVQYTVNIETPWSTASKPVSGVFDRTGSSTVELPYDSQPNDANAMLVVTIRSVRDGGVQSQVWRQSLQFHN